MMIKLKPYILFLLAVGLTILGLTLFNALPELIQDNTLRRYPSLDEAKHVLHLQKIQVPPYFPQNFEWPPQEVIAQKKPYPLILLHFIHKGSNQVVLALTQTDKRNNNTLLSRIEPTQILETSEIRLKNTTATLYHGLGPTHEACNKITWEDNENFFALVLQGSSNELIKMAASMME